MTLEENVQSGGMGEHIAMFLATERIDMGILSIAIPNQFVEHGNVEILKQALRMDADSVTQRIMEVL